MVWLSTANNLGGLAGGGSETFAELTDTPESITADQFVVGNAAGNRLVFSAINPGTAGASEFAQLTDTPASITANQLVSGNADGTALQFIPVPTPQAATTTFASLTDTPASITADQFVRGNTGGDALEFEAGNLLTDDRQSKIDGIAEGAEVNVQSNWDETNTGSDAFIQNKNTGCQVCGKK